MSGQPHVMISYQSTDSRIADVIHQEVALRGLSVLRDQSSFVRGQRVGVSMEHAIATCDAFLTLLTPNSLYLDAEPDAPGRSWTTSCDRR